MSELIVSRPTPSLDDSERARLEEAVALLERPGLAARLAELMGRQIDIAGRALPESARAVVAQATMLALRAALRVAVRGMSVEAVPAATRRDRFLAAATGAAGGAFGLAALPIELPASTIVMLRAIAEIAREHGEDPRAPETALACLEVFALGGRAPGDPDSVNSSYFATRAMLARSISEATRYIVERGAIDETAPFVARFLARVAARFGLVVTRKVAAQALPIIGAVGGAALNYAFIDHFQALARGHFTVRQLERRHGTALVRAEYNRIIATA